MAPLQALLPEGVGKYRFGGKIASGGMAEVYMAQPLSRADQPAVVKVMHPHLASDPLYRSMFVREARLCSRLKHPNIVRLKDFYANSSGLFLIFELVDGLDVRRLLQTCASRRIAIPPPLAAFIVAHLLEALDYAHTLRIGDDSAAVVHRDLSPSNVMLSWRGHIKLADFGVAQVVDRVPSREKALLTGKFAYMSPEQVRGEDLDGRSDLFSAGIILAELLMGRKLFRERSTAELLIAVDNVKLDRLKAFGSNVPPELLEIVHRALTRDRNNRFSTGAEFRDALAGWLSRSPVRTGSHTLAAFLRDIRPMVAPAT